MGRYNVSHTSTNDALVVEIEWKVEKCYTHNPGTIGADSPLYFGFSGLSPIQQKYS
jgi:hypothetical protein